MPWHSLGERLAGQLRPRQRRGHDGGGSSRQRTSAPGGFSGNVPRTDRGQVKGDDGGVEERLESHRVPAPLSLLAVGDLWPLCLGA